MKGFDKTTYIIADDHTIFREGLKILLEGEKSLVFAGEASDGIQLVKLVRETQPQIVFTDIVMPGMDGLNAVKAIIRDLPKTGIIALSMFDEEQLVVDMMEAGALGYLRKDVEKMQLLEAIWSVKNNTPYYSENLSKRMLKRFAASTFNPYLNRYRVNLSHRDVAIIQHICNGYTNKEIANTMKFSKRSVDTYRKTLMDKLELNNSAALIIYAIKMGIYEVRD